MKKVLKYLVLSFLFVAGNVYASPANDMFIDDNLYKCVVDNYNGEKGTSYKYTDVIYQADFQMDEEGESHHLRGTKAG